jgi:PmbA protein
MALARLSGEDACAGLPGGPFAGNVDGTGLELHDPAVLGQDPQDLIALARRSESAARGFDPRVTNSEGAHISRQSGTVALANTRGFAGMYRTTSCSLDASAVVEDADDTILGGLQTPEDVGETAARKALAQLGARKSTTREAPVVWSPEMSRMLLYLFSMVVSGEARYQGNSFLIDREGDRIGSSLVTIVDDGTLPGRLGSRPFDGEGLASRRTPIFDEGTFKGFLFDSYSARRSNRESTSNAGRSVAFQRGMIVGVGPSNLSIEGGSSTPDEVIGGVSDGLYLTDILGFGGNFATGDFSCGAAGMWIENGALSYPVAEITIAGRMQEMLADVDAVGNDVSILDDMAAPTLRIAKMMVSGS